MRVKWAIILAVIALAIAAAVALAETHAYVQESNNGKIDWLRGRIFVVGEGTPKVGTIKGQKRLTAKIAARDDALRNVASVVSGVAVNNDTQTVDSALASDVIRTKVSAFIKAGIYYDDPRHPLMQALGYADLGWNPDDEVYRVVMEVPMYGAQNSMAVAVLQPVILAPAKPNAPVEYQDVPPPDTRNIPASGPTGLIVDCSSADIEPAMSPKIYNKDTRQEIYGGASVDTDTAVRKGIAGYVTTMEAARKATERVGGNPMIVPAVAAVGRRAVAVSGEDAQRILDSDRQGGFLKQCGVMFVLKAQQ